MAQSLLGNYFNIFTSFKIYLFFRRLNITFRIVHNISHGGYGAVYEVTSSRDDGRYALKLEQRQYTRDHYKLMMEVQVCNLV